MWLWKLWSYDAINSPLSNSFTHKKQEMSTVKLHRHLKTAFIFPYVLITLTLPVFMWENDQCIKRIEIRAKLMTQHHATLEAECDFGSVNCMTSNSCKHFDYSNIKIHSIWKKFTSFVRNYELSLLYHWKHRSKNLRWMILNYLLAKVGLQGLQNKVMMITYFLNYSFCQTSLMTKRCHSQFDYLTRRQKRWN